jgi:hypothetical protein
MIAHLRVAVAAGSSDNGPVPTPFGQSGRLSGEEIRAET